jgi:hypothetical protein
MVTKHTPAPWAVYQLADDVHTYGADANKWIVTADHHENEICGVVQTIEDANLIAAAPDLLEACKALLLLVPRNKLHPVGYTNGKQDKANDLARAAICKAEGI